VDDPIPTYLTSADLKMLEGVLRDALFDLLRLKAIPCERTAYLDAKSKLAVILMKQANQGERCPERLRQHAVFRGFQTMMTPVEGSTPMRAGR
jgi:hypothetical protein